MGYRPRGEGILVSFDADWRKSDYSKIDEKGLRKDFHNVVQDHLSQMYPDLYVRAFGYGTNGTKHSVYIELKGAEKASDMENSVTLKFYDFMGPGGSPLHFYNFNIKQESLKKLEKINSSMEAPEIKVIR